MTLKEFLDWVGQDWIRPICLVFITAIVFGTTIGGCCYVMKSEFDYKIEVRKLFYNKGER